MRRSQIADKLKLIRNFTTSKREFNCFILQKKSDCRVPTNYVHPISFQSAVETRQQNVGGKTVIMLFIHDYIKK